MTPTEIKELLRLKRWSKTRLAAELGLSQNAVERWLGKSRNPRGPTAILLHQWLNAARAEHAATKVAAATS